MSISHAQVQSSHIKNMQINVVFRLHALSRGIDVVLRVYVD